MHSPLLSHCVFTEPKTMLDETMLPLVTTPPGRYRHYKGMLYDVVGTVRHSESLEPMTLYRRVPDPHAYRCAYCAAPRGGCACLGRPDAAHLGEHGLWVRPAAMFNEEVVIDGLQQPRFARVADDTPSA